MRYRFPGIHNSAGSTTGSVERKDSPDLHVKSWDVECLEHDFCHLFSVCLGIERRFREEDRMLIGRDAKLVVEGYFIPMIPRLANASSLKPISQFGADAEVVLTQHNSLLLDIRLEKSPDAEGGL
ncbi:hypothetical protein MVEN_02140700 [Mycena venus]|uniref:Uncharacterized protein n=1 Tax=Mycena venus TaxID=2733690 RepID=A0A8H6X9C3_9AGAR|nr:hypothetical protein MVEN_02140700 [Mycena venus]